MGKHLTAILTIHEVTEGTPPETDRYGKATSPGTKRETVEVVKITTRGTSLSTLAGKVSKLLDVEVSYKAEEQA